MAHVGNKHSLPRTCIDHYRKTFQFSHIFENNRAHHVPIYCQRERRSFIDKIKIEGNFVKKR